MSRKGLVLSSIAVLLLVGFGISLVMRNQRHRQTTSEVGDPRDYASMEEELAKVVWSYFEVKSKPDLVRETVRTFALESEAPLTRAQRDRLDECIGHFLNHLCNPSWSTYSALAPIDARTPSAATLSSMKRLLASPSVAAVSPEAAEVAATGGAEEILKLLVELHAGEARNRGEVVALAPRASSIKISTSSRAELASMITGINLGDYPQRSGTHLANQIMSRFDLKDELAQEFQTSEWVPYADVHTHLMIFDADDKKEKPISLGFRMYWSSRSDRWLPINVWYRGPRVGGVFF